MTDTTWTPDRAADLLMRLSDADAIAGEEGQVRRIMDEACAPLADEVLHDRLGSVAYHLRGAGQDGVRILVCAHMDEVGFVVRTIDDIGMLHVLPLGGVQDRSKEMQLVRVTTQRGERHRGVMNVARDASGKVTDTYVDLGGETAEEVRGLGVAEGDMVTFDTTATLLGPGLVAGKALDDRAGLVALASALRKVGPVPTNDLYFAGTSSEEVGTRGGKTMTQMLRPDLVLAVDVANHPELDRGAANHRRLGAGPMVVHHDKTMAPNRRLLAWVRDTLAAEGIPFQRDMLGGGGTDAAQAHLVGSGTLALVLGIPLRYCHGSCSFVRMDDIEGAARAVVALTEGLTRDVLDDFLDF